MRMTIRRRSPRLQLPCVNYLALLSFLGSDRDIEDRIRRAGFVSPPIKTIQGWRTRASVPGKWAPILISMALRDGTLKSVDSLIEKLA
jgi:hypothetical protein